MKTSTRNQRFSKMINDESHRFTRRRFMAASTAIVTLFLAITAVGQTALAREIEGTVMVGGRPGAGATVTLWRTAGKDSPESLREATADSNGRFAFHVVMARADGNVFYLTTRGGAHDALALMSVLGTEPPDDVVVNELTTVASVFTSARFIEGTAIRGNPLGLRIAAGNAPNLVDPATGTWGKVLLDPINSTENTTLVRLNTLGALIAAFGTVADDTWRAEFLKAATPTERSDTQGHPRGDGRHRARTVGQPEGALCAVRQGLPATKGWFQAQRALCAVSCLPTARLRHDT